MRLKLNKITAAYQDQVVLRDMSLGLDSGGVGALLGPSGCGKTTVLRCIAGFEGIHSGEIQLEEQLLSSDRLTVPAHQRAIGMVFQDYALLPHLTVFDNVLFGLHQLDSQASSHRGEQMLALVGLSKEKDAYPNELSGGEQQRVALARALAPGPGVLLMDEPFSNLDADLRERLSRDVRDIVKELGITTLLVTHDQREAFAFADQVTVMNKGVVEQTGSPSDLYMTPRSVFVADFIGEGFFLHGQVQANQVSTSLGVFSIHDQPDTQPGPATVLFRPEDLRIVDESRTRGVIVSLLFRGSTQLASVRLETGETVMCQIPKTQRVSVDDPVAVGCMSEVVSVFST